MKMASSLAVVVMLLSLNTVIAENLKLLLLHTNDMHARFEQTDRYSGKCRGNGSACYGGFARVHQVVSMKRNAYNTGQGPPVLFLVAGDTFQGTVWYTMYKWAIAARFTNLINPDAMSLGNHEFDDGLEGLVPFIKNTTCPILATNLDLSHEPSLRNSGLQNSTVITVKGVKIAIIGYVTPDTKKISRSENVEFLDEVTSIKEEISRLKDRHSDINIFIALGHSGYDMDKVIARSVPDIDVVVGGHTNTFLYSGGNKPDLEKPEGLYPTEIIQPDTNKKVLVVQAYAYTKYMGQLALEFNDRGEVLNYSGNPILLDRKIKRDPIILAELELWRRNLSDFIRTEVGKTKVLLGGDKFCRIQECNLGNLVADAFVDYMARTYRGKGWTDTPIAIQNGGGIRTSINSLDNKGIVTREEMMGVLPFTNNMVRMRLSGYDVLEMLEHSVAKYNRLDASGEFLQFSGMRVTYNLSSESGHRVVEALARCGDCEIPMYFPVEKDKDYYIIMTAFLATGGDGFDALKRNFHKEYEMDVTDTEMVIEYIQKRSPVYPGIEGRVVLHYNEEQQRHSSGSKIQTIFPLHLIIFITVLDNLYKWFGGQ